MKTRLLASLAVALILVPAGWLRAGWQAGLLGGPVGSTSLNTTTYPASTNVYLGPHVATNRVATTSASTEPWKSNQTWVYWGQVYLPAGTVWFAEHIDDAAHVRIWNGATPTTLLNNSVATTATAGFFTAPAAGWYPVEIRMWNGTGAAGPTVNSGWTATKGLGYKLGGATSTDGALYTYPQDDGFMSLFRYDDGLGFDNVLYIAGFPVSYGAVEPPYGYTNGLTAGDAFLCSAPAGTVAVAAGTRARCAGYALYTNETALVLASSGATNAFWYTHDLNARLVWQWGMEYEMVFTAGAGGSVSATGGWYAEGSNVTVTATADAGYAFAYWTGNMPEAQRTQATLSFPTAAPVTAAAVFGQTYYVCTNGDDSADGLSWATAKKSLEVAVAAAGAAGEIILSNGVHNITSLWVEVTQPLTIRSLNGPEVTELKANASGVNRRVMHVNHAGAVVSGLTMWNGVYDAAQKTTDSGPGGLRLTDGTVTNCIIRNNRGGANSNNGNGSGGADVRGGLLTHCRIIGNRSASDPNGNISYGSGIRVSGGIVEHCVISNNPGRAHGCGVYMTGGTVQDSLIAENPAEVQRPEGQGVKMTGGTLERCVVRGYLKALRGGGIYLNSASAVARNCLVIGNTATEGGGVHLANGTLQNVTVADNLGNHETGSGINRASGLRQTGGTVENCIIFGNGGLPIHDPEGNVHKTAGTFTRSCTLPAQSGTDNVAADPLFTNPAGGDYTLMPGSPCLDAASTLAAVTDDLNGTARPLDGDGDADAKPDLGCFEAPAAGAGALRCGFTVSPDEGYLTLEPTFTATVHGALTNGLWYGWDFDGNGTVDATGANLKTTTHAYAQPGFHTVKLVVGNNLGAEAQASRKACARISPKTAYVSKTGQSIAPYDTWEKATTNLNAALFALLPLPGAELGIVVTNGTYDLVDFWVPVAMPVAIRSLGGPSVTTLKAVNPPQPAFRRVMLVNHPDAFVSGFSMINGSVSGRDDEGSGPGGLRLLAGTVSNCVVRGHVGVDNCGGVELGGGLLTHTTVDNNSAYHSGNANRGKAGGVWIYGGAMRDCVITNNWASGDPHFSGGRSGGGVRQTGGTIERCRIERNRGGNSGNVNRQGGGLCQEGGTATACIIQNNTVYGIGGGAYLTGGALRSSLVAGNKAATATGDGHGLYLNGAAARIENATVVDNSYGIAGSGVYLNNGKMTNSIAWYNGTVDVNPVGGSIGYSAWSGAAEINGNIGANPGFVARAQGNYRLSGGSPCVNKGVNYLWTASDRDLDDNLRILFRVCDMGAYECTITPGMIIVVR